MKKLFLSLDDAVRVAVRHFGVDAEIACQEFEQKCYVSDDQYNIGYNDGIDDAIKAIKQTIEGAES
jgi:hypothetical protein